MDGGVKSGPLSIPVESTAPISISRPPSPRGRGHHFSSVRNRGPLTRFDGVGSAPDPSRPQPMSFGPIDEVGANILTVIHQPLGWSRLRISVIVAVRSHGPDNISKSSFAVSHVAIISPNRTPSI